MPLIVLLAAFAGASGMVPTCAFSTGEGGSIFGGAKYDVAKAYRAAAVVVIGHAATAAKGDGTPIEFRLTRRLKGPPGPDTIRLVGSECHGTACSGLSLPIGVEILALLKEGPGGIYGKVDGDGDDACPNLFEVKGESVVVAGKPVALARFLRRLKAKSSTIAYE